MFRLSASIAVRVALSLALALAFAPAARAAEVCARGGIVASACPIASAVGAGILERGGNAVDAAVAVGFALAVTYPQAGNIGGGGFMLVRLGSGRTTFLDFRERAPLAARRDMYLDERGEIIENLSLLGALAAGVPGSVSGLHRAHELHGTLPWADLLAPAVALARGGFPVSARLAASLERLEPYIERYPGLRRFRRPDGSALAPGDTLVQPELAGTLEIIARDGPRGFYDGPIADLIVAGTRDGGGIISKEDLAAYATAERAPVRGDYRGFEIISAPPPSSGGAILIEILNVLERFDLGAMNAFSEEAIHVTVEAERRGFADRARYLGDPDFVEDMSALLTSKDYAGELARTIAPRASSSSSVAGADAAGREKRETTHYSVVDKRGNAVATTVTLNDSYGSRFMVEGAGFLLNNEMDDFSVKAGAPNLYGLVGGEANAIEPGKRMLSSMAPTIVLREGKPVLVLGTPGGSTIITTVAQVIVDIVDFGMTLEEAVAAPRFHHQWLPDAIRFEPGILTERLRRRLEDRGHSIDERSDSIGDVQAIHMGGACPCGVSDPRGGGAAAGVDIVDSGTR